MSDLPDAQRARFAQEANPPRNRSPKGFSHRWSGRETAYGPCEGFVYFIGCGGTYTTHVKVGFTSGSPHKRMAALQTGCPFRLKLLGYVIGCRSMEKELHSYFSEYAVGGEWFVFEGNCEAQVVRIITTWECWDREAA